MAKRGRGKAFFGGVLTGIGLSCYVFGFFAVWMMQHVVTAGVNTLLMVIVCLLPLLIIGPGLWMARDRAEKGRTEKNEQGS
ncbi:hypothetical protein SAMN05421819_3201 [Bryocella elongata]|uniref:Uncharacterized protein n=1 Tax=Bryocella elongata TaxID=863522 RepID=A0A1H6AJ66_9BACT|nr:hypothetical protein [Bryocella elongata]SEG48748.1 hypothetical protein SAMN05421819_3201 [Bryocella elongata]